MKLPMLKLWQNSLIRENCSTFIVLNSTILSISMILKKVILPFYSIDTSRYVSWSALHFIAFQGLFLWGCSIILKMIFNSSDHFTIFITAPVSSTLSNCPTHEENTNFKVLNRVTSFILKFKYRNKV